MVMYNLDGGKGSPCTATANLSDKTASRLQDSNDTKADSANQG